MIGIVCGLAIYNFTIINLPFPLALYKKLLGDKTEGGELFLYTKKEQKSFFWSCQKGKSSLSESTNGIATYIFDSENLS